MLLVLAVFIATFWIPNDPFFLNGYLKTACVLSLGFLGFQALYILVCAVLVNERLVKNVEVEGEGQCSCSAVIWLIFFVLVTGANITWIVMMFLNFATIEGCGTNLTMLIITTVAAFIMQILPCFRLREDASELTSAFVILYTLFLQWTAFVSNTDEQCNP